MPLGKLVSDTKSDLKGKRREKQNKENTENFRNCFLHFQLLSIPKVQFNRVP